MSPSVTVLQLTDGAYEQVASGTGEDVMRVELPFPVERTPASLLAE